MPAKSPVAARNGSRGRPSGPRPAPAEAQILFQSYFKSVGPRTYAAQVKQAGNGNHFLVLTEGKRDDASGEVKKTRLFVFSEDFPAFFRLIKESAEFVKTHPVPESVKRKREAFWAKHPGGAGIGGDRDQARRPRGARGGLTAKPAN